jgi:hypothetical protein
VTYPEFQWITAESLPLSKFRSNIHRRGRLGKTVFGPPATYQTRWIVVGAIGLKSRFVYPAKAKPGISDNWCLWSKGGMRHDRRDPRERCPLHYMDENEIVELHERLAFCVRMTGLSGHALDKAISAAFTACVAIIERERSIHDKRRATIREVQ